VTRHGAASCIVLGGNAHPSTVPAACTALMSRNKSRPCKVKAWSSGEARQFLESAREGRDSLYAAFVRVLCLGMRKGEVLGPMWNAVDLAAGD